jgi:hypothetical protein
MAPKCFNADLYPAFGFDAVPDLAFYCGSGIRLPKLMQIHWNRIRNFAFQGAHS